ncbi:MAG: DegT/DnrJ/EryC1/StrS family aminotransferase, partial [Proteobacteria bacterium]|nr:DegT/DnrJ/EryC1/StrS family aminotransferase [Pseudomonadota bacterium]
AIIPVNVFGCPPDYEAFGQLARDRGVRLIYDSAQGLGSRFQPADGAWRYSGVFGDAEVFSLSPTKVISAMEGGLITTHNRALADQLRQMRDYGKSANGEDIAWLGLSARVPEINAIVGRHSFEKLDSLVARRHELISAYQAAFKDLQGVTCQQIPPNRLSSGNYFTLFISDEARASRDEAYRRLNSRGIQTKKYFYPALHLQTVYCSLRETYQGRLPVTEAASAKGLALPLFSHMTPETFQQVVDEVLEVLS